MKYIAIMAILLLIPIPYDTYAKELDMIVTPLVGSDTFILYGKTDSDKQITIKGYSPNGTRSMINYLEPVRDGDFKMFVRINDLRWSENGNYTITAYQGNKSASIEVEIQDGIVIPEFGHVAIIILGIGMISIIALRRKLPVFEIK